MRLADEGAEKAINNPEMREALTCLGGKIMNKPTADALGITAQIRQKRKRQKRNDGVI